MQLHGIVRRLNFRLVCREDSSLNGNISPVCGRPSITPIELSGIGLGTAGYAKTLSHIYGRPRNSGLQHGKTRPDSLSDGSKFFRLNTEKKPG